MFVLFTFIIDNTKNDVCDLLYFERLLNNILIVSK